MLTKEETLKTFKKYAKEIGKTPSEKKLYKDTSVTIWDRMKYWSNYGELVREAGLTPNIFDKTKYSQVQLCEIFIKVIREKNKWPTRGELDVKHYNDSIFPSSSTFYNKLGLTGELAQTILKYVDDKRGYDDIVKICNLALKKYEKYNDSSKTLATSEGFVYLGKQHGVYKIGETNDLNRRREELSTQASEPMVYLHDIKTDDRYGVEKYWHNRFKSKKKKKGKTLRGEWFNLCSSDVKAFKRWRKIF